MSSKKLRITTNTMSTYGEIPDTTIDINTYKKLGGLPVIDVLPQQAGLVSGTIDARLHDNDTRGQTPDHQRPESTFPGADTEEPAAQNIAEELFDNPEEL